MFDCSGQNFHSATVSASPMLAVDSDRMRDLTRLIELVQTLTGASDRAEAKASSEAIERLLHRYPHLPSDVLDFYGIANGCRLSDPWWEFVEIDGVLATAAMLDAMIGADFADWVGWWSTDWAPIGADVSGNALCVNATSVSGDTRGQVLIFMHDDATRRIVAPSLGAYLEQLRIATETGVIRYEPDDGFGSEENQERWDAFLSKQLPGYPIEARARLAR